jgi:pyocin large subunit-like protein
LHARRRSARQLVAVFLVAVALTLVAAACGKTDPAAQAEAQPTATTITRPDVGFRSGERLDEHYRKHGPEFGSVGRDAYLRLAQSLRDRPVGGPVLEVVRRNGVVTRFDRSSGAFIAFEGDGVIRTFFRPNDGEDYFLRQARR